MPTRCAGRFNGYEAVETGHGQPLFEDLFSDGGSADIAQADDRDLVTIKRSNHGSRVGNPGTGTLDS